MVAFTFGIPGVGKSTVLKEVAKELPIERIHWGNLAYEIAKEEGIDVGYDQMRRQSLSVQKDLQAKTADRIVEIVEADRSKHYVIETHAALKTPQGYMPGLTHDIIAKLKPDTFIIYEAHSGHIYHRRMIDESRDRSDDTTIDGVDLNLDVTRYFGAAFAVEAHGTVFVIENREGDLEYAVEKTKQALGAFIN